MNFKKASIDDFELICKMMVDARKKSWDEGVFQWNENYPTATMIKGDLEKGYTYLVYDEGKIVAFFTTNSICEDDVHDHIKWLNEGDNWVILHRLCVDTGAQGNKIGQRILALFEKEKIEEGFDSIRIDVFSTNAAAIHIYEKFGYILLGNATCDRGMFYIYEKMLPKQKH